VSETETRRTFYQRVIYGLGALITSALALPGLAYLFGPPRSHRSSTWIDAGKVESLPAGRPQEVAFLKTKIDGWRVSTEKATAWVVRNREDEVVAFTPQCTHLGCGYHWSEDQKHFVCPCHDSLFDLEGRVITGPAPRALDRYQVKLDGGRLWLGPPIRGGETGA
jgi:menaquinol-cytochrome c reductase iron-sulfur subunit